MATRLVPLVLLLLLCAAASSPAAAVELPPVVDPSVLALEDEEEPEAEAAAEEGEEECGEAEEGFEGCEEVEAEPARTASAREECVLRSARAHAALDRRGEKLKLTIGYTASEPARAKIEIHRGNQRLAAVKRHLGRSGVLRITEKLGASKGGSRLVVDIEIPSARSAGCPFRRLVLSPR